MSWLDIIKIKSSKTMGRKAARDVRIVLVEAGFPLTYIGDINMRQWGQGEHSKIFQINPAYLIEAANDFNEWLDNLVEERSHSYLYERNKDIPSKITSEEAGERIVELINQAIHKEEKDKYRKETTFEE